MVISYEQFFENWLLEAFWQMIDDLEVHYTLRPEIAQMLKHHPEIFGQSSEEQLENYMLQRLYVNHDDSWWEGIHSAQNEAFWEKAKNVFFTAALSTLFEIFAESTRLNEDTSRLIQRHFKHRLPLEEPLETGEPSNKKAFSAKRRTYHEYLHIMAYVWTHYFFVHFTVLFPTAHEAKLFGPHHRRAHFRLLSSSKESQPKDR